MRPGARCRSRDPGARRAERYVDVEAPFLIGVIPLVEQGIEVAAVAEWRTERDELQALADEVTERSLEEQTSLAAIAAERGLAPPDADAAGEGLDNVVSDPALADLRGLDGHPFDLAFADAMAGIHGSVIVEAQTILDVGEDQGPPRRRRGRARRRGRRRKLGYSLLTFIIRASV